MAPGPTQDLTIREVAVLLHCSDKTVRRLARSGKLRGYKLGTRDWRFTPDSVSAYRQRRSAAEPLQQQPKTRVNPSRRGAQLPGWHDYDHGGRPS